MKLAVPLLLAAPALAAAVTPTPAPAAPVEVIPSPGGAPPAGGAGVVVRAPWRSAALIAAVAELQRAPLLPYTRTAGLVTCGQLVRAAEDSPRLRNPAFPAIPRLSAAELAAAAAAALGALEAGVEAMDPGGRGGFLVATGGGTIGHHLALTAILADKADARPSDLTPLGRAAWQVAELRRALARVPSQRNQYYLGSGWRSISYLCEWMDTVGAPLFGAEGFGGAGAAVESLYVGLRAAEGTIGGALVTAGGAVAGVAGDATWALIASPVGLAAAGLLLIWITT